MRKFAWIPILLALSCMVTHSAFAQVPLKVAVYDDEGTGASKADVAACLSDPTLFDVSWVMGADIRAGVLQGVDVLIHPGGSGSGQAESLQASGRDSVRAFIARGGGYLGICAGSYLASSDYTWSLHIMNTKVIDRAHWNRGGGSADVHFSNWGRSFFGFVDETVVIEYRQGALMAPALVDTLPGYIEAGTFQTEFTENGAPEGVMIGTSAFAFSRFHEGRVVAFSPHPEITVGRESMVADAVRWAAADDPYLGIASPRDQKPLEVGTVARVEWVAEDMDDPVLVEFSPDDGATWETVASGLTAPHNWTVPATPAESCLLRVTSLADGSLVDTVQLSLEPAPLSIQSIQTGDWSDPATWDGNVVPTAADNVIVGSGHRVTVDAEAGCRDLSFVDGLGRLALQADLRLHGDFNRFGTLANPFYDGGNLWATGAKMIFTGDAEVQAITGLGTTSTNPYPLRFGAIVVDKSDGKLTTNPVEGLESGYRLGIGTSLEIVNGTFELARRDDIEGRSPTGSSTRPTITVQENGVFRMAGSYSHIRRGNWIGNDSSKIGKMTVFGEAHLANSSSNRVNMNDIDIEDGGLVTIPYYSAGGSMGTGRFNPGTVTVKAGGTFKYNLTNSIWYDNSTTPNLMALLDGGTITSASSAPKYPAFSTNEGTVVYGRNSSAQTVFDMEYHDLAVTGSGGVVFAADVTVNGTCTVSGGNAVTGDFALLLGPDANLVESDGRTVVGTVDVTRSAVQAENQDFGGVGLEILAAGNTPGLTRVVRTTGSFADKAANDGIARYFQIFPANNSGLDASVLFRYDDAEVIVADEGLLTLFARNGGGWTEIPSSRDLTANTVAAVGFDSFAELTLGYEGVVATTVHSVAVVPAGLAVGISWSTVRSFPAGDFSVYRLEGEARRRVALAGGVVATDGLEYRYVDDTAEPGTMCCYQIVIDDGDQARVLYETETIEIPRPAFKLDQNHPNPFNPLTVIEYSIPRSGHVTLDIYDIAGRRVSRVVDAVQTAGPHSEKWTGTDQRGNPLASGTYFYRMTTDGRELVRKMVLLR